MFGEWCKGCKHLDRLPEDPLATLNKDSPCFECSIDVIDHGIPTEWELGISYYLEVQRLREARTDIMIIDVGETTRM